jgi:hypothetical protein
VCDYGIQLAGATGAAFGIQLSGAITVGSPAAESLADATVAPVLAWELSAAIALTVPPTADSASTKADAAVILVVRRICDIVILI